MEQTGDCRSARLVAPSASQAVSTGPHPAREITDESCRGCPGRTRLWPATLQKIGVSSERVGHEIHEGADTGSVAQILMGQQPQIEPEIFRKHGGSEKVEGAVGYGARQRRKVDPGPSRGNRGRD